MRICCWPAGNPAWFGGRAGVSLGTDGGGNTGRLWRTRGTNPPVGGGSCATETPPTIKIVPNMAMRNRMTSLTPAVPQRVSSNVTPSKERTTQERTFARKSKFFLRLWVTTELQRETNLRRCSLMSGAVAAAECIWAATQRILTRNQSAVL